MGYRPITPRRELTVDALVTVHYFEYASTYYFEGESHDFWELLYVDKGEVNVEEPERRCRLKRGELLFHPPGTFHALRATGLSAPNLVVVSFFCRGEAMSFFRDRVLTLNSAERALLGRMVEQAAAAFQTPLDDPTTTSLARRAEVPFGAEELLVLALEELLVRLIRRGGAEERAAELSGPLRDQIEDEIARRVAEYLESNLSRRLTLEEVCRANLVGRSRLQKAFRAETGGGVMEYFTRRKIESAKEMIRCGGRNFTEISTALGYQSIYYFSRQFKKETGMTPSEYAASVKAVSGKNRVD